MISLHPTKRSHLASLFVEHRSTFLIDTVLEGHAGTAVVDDAARPNVARLYVADVVAFGGDAYHPHAASLVRGLPLEKGILPAPGGWRSLILDEHGDQIVATTRHSFSDRALNPKRLQQCRDALPPPYRIERIDERHARTLYERPDLLSPDLVGHFQSPRDFVRRGIGFCVLIADRIVAGASSYVVCNRGIEIQVNTHPQFLRRGLATAVSAELILHCLQTGRDAHWDAANDASARLAVRLGYIPTGTYEMLIRIAAPPQEATPSTPRRKRAGLDGRPVRCHPKAC